MDLLNLRPCQLIMLHFHTSDQREFLWFKCDVSQPQLSRCVTTSLVCYTTSQWNVVQLPIEMHIITLQLHWYVVITPENQYKQVALQLYI